MIEEEPSRPESNEHLKPTDVNFFKLGGTGKRIVYGHKLTPASANALMTRALLEGRDQEQTQDLFKHYAQARGLE